MHRPRRLESSLSRTGSRAEFRVTTNEDAVREVLSAMGFQAARGFSFRSVPDSADVPRIFENFAAHIEEMVRQKMREIPARWEHALEVAVQRLTGEVDWWLSGSAALAIRGIDVSPRDIDLVVDDARHVGALFSDLLVEPVTPMKEWVADWFGRAFDGALIEWVADVHAGAGQAGRHEQGPEAAARRDRVTWRAHEIRCSPIDAQLAVTEARGLTAQAEAIRQFIAKSSDRSA